jgi:fatty-acid desaturase
MGELFQNNHHKSPNDANFAKKWFELDPTWQVIRALNAMHIIRLRKQPARRSLRLEGKKVEAQMEEVEV